MRKLLLATTAFAALGIAHAVAQDAPVNPQVDDGTVQSDRETTETRSRGAGAAGGAATGAIAGAVVGGPIGAVVGGFAGAVIGAETAVPEPAVQYVVANPVEPVTLEGRIVEGMVVPETATLQPIPEYPDYAYVYADGRPVIVKAQTREVVYSPGYVVPDQTVTYVEQNPVDPVTVDTTITTGSVVPQEVEIVPVPEDPAYGYIYTESGPVLVERSSRTVVWTR